MCTDLYSSFERWAKLGASPARICQMLAKILKGEKKNRNPALKWMWMLIGLRLFPEIGTLTTVFCTHFLRSMLSISRANSSTAHVGTTLEAFRTTSRNLNFLKAFNEHASSAYKIKILVRKQPFYFLFHTQGS